MCDGAGLAAGGRAVQRPPGFGLPGDRSLMRSYNDAATNARRSRISILYAARILGTRSTLVLAELLLAPGSSRGRARAPSRRLTPAQPGRRVPEPSQRRPARSRSPRSAGRPPHAPASARADRRADRDRPPPDPESLAARGRATDEVAGPSPKAVRTNSLPAPRLVAHARQRQPVRRRGLPRPASAAGPPAAR